MHTVAREAARWLAGLAIAGLVTLGLELTPDQAAAVHTVSEVVIMAGLALGYLATQWIQQRKAKRERML